THAAAREVDAGDGVHVRDDRVSGEGAVRWYPRVQGLEREDAAQPLVADEPAYRRGEAPETAEGGQPDKLGGEERERGVEVRVDEPGHLQLVQFPQPGA